MTLAKRENNYVWKRLSDVRKHNDYFIFKEPLGLKDDPDIVTEDVIQGSLGDCYFLSVLSALAENPSRIKKLIPNLNIVPAGCFEAIVFIHGEPVKVVVDDYFPFHEHNEDETPCLAFVGINENSKNIWPAILEKVWAKVNISYENIIAGNSSEAFEFLTAAPIDTYYHEAFKDKLFEKLQDADSKNFIICTDISDITGNSALSNLTRVGLIPNHAYTIIDVATVSDIKGNTIKLLKIRNPWGTNEWTGDWSDRSTKWTAEYKKLLNHDVAEDGTFWINYTDFLKYYTCTHVCRIHDNFHYVSEKYPFDINEAFNMVEIEIPKDSHGYFMVNQKNTRIYRIAKGLEDYENKYCSMIVFKKERDGKLVYIGSSCGRDNRLYVETNMTKGTYYVCVSFPSKVQRISEDHEKHKRQQTINLNEEILTYRVGVYSLFEKVNIFSSSHDHPELVKRFLNETITDLAIKNQDRYYFTDEGESESFRTISFEKEGGTYGYFYYENNSEGWINEYINFNQFENINLIPLLGNGDISKLNLEHYDIEDTFEHNQIQALKSKVNLESSINILRVVPDDEEVTEDNPIEVLIKVAPKSKCLILIEKFDLDSGIDFSSKVVINYPIHVLLNEKKFPPKRNKIKYNNKPIDIFEKVIEHTSGVIFKYRNRTKDLKLTAHLIFSNLENLKLGLKSEEIKESDFTDDNKDEGQQTDNFVNSDNYNHDIEIDDPNKEVVIVLEPGHSKFFELKVKDELGDYGYDCSTDYHINISRKKA